MAADDRDYAIFLLKKNRANLVWSGAVTFENNPVTLPATQTILEGLSVSGLTIDEQSQVINLGKGIALLAELLKSGQFAFTKEVACKIHEAVGKDEALTWGTFRNRPVSIQNVAHAPPPAELLDELWKSTERTIGDLINSKGPQYASAEAFCQMARTQFFFDCNKRTAWLMSLGILVDAGLPPYALDVRDKERFNNILAEFYNTGDSTNMVNLLHEYAGYEPGKDKIHA